MRCSGVFYRKRDRNELLVFADPCLALCLLGGLALVGSSFAIAPDRLIGDVYGFLTSVFFGLYFLAVRVGRRNHGAGALTFMTTIVTAGLLLGVTLTAGQGFWPHTLVGISALLALGAWRFVQLVIPEALG